MRKKVWYLVIVSFIVLVIITILLDGTNIKLDISAQEVINPEEISYNNEIKVKANQGSHSSTYLSILNQSELDFKFNIKKTADNKEAVVNWLNILPSQRTISPGDSSKIELVINAKKLPVGKHQTYLYLNSQQLEEPLVVDMQLNVVGAPIIKLQNIRVVDGSQSGTLGNQDQIANPGERIRLDLKLKNIGNAKARDLVIEASDRYDLVFFVDGNKRTISSIDHQGQKTKTISYYLDISEKVSTDTPPSIEVAVKDNKNNTWLEDFYLASQGVRIEYPLGLEIEDE